jgi:hypothetical protein
MLDTVVQLGQYDVTLTFPYNRNLPSTEDGLVRGLHKCIQCLFESLILLHQLRLRNVILVVTIQVNLVTAGAEVFSRELLDYRGEELLNKCDYGRRCKSKLTSGRL